mgnify:CR=1 FL=1
MTSRERVLAALEHREPDRVPLDLGGSFVTSITAVALDELRRHLRLQERPVKVVDAYQMLGEVEMDVVERLHLDCLPVEPPVLTMGLRREHWKPWRLMDGREVLMPGEFEVQMTPEGDWLFSPPGSTSGVPTAKMPRGGFYFDTLGETAWNFDWEPPPLADMAREFESAIASEEDLAHMAQRAALLRRTTDKALVLNCWGMLGPRHIGTMPDFLCLLGRNPGYVRGLFDLATEVGLRNLRLMWDAIGEDIDVVVISGLDFGTQKAELFSRQTFREVYLPCLQAHYEWIRTHTTWKSFEHSCGCMTSIIGDMAEAGLDAINPVQTSAAGMDPAWLKTTWGDRLTFWGGGVETQSTLPFGTPEQVRAEVAERVRLFAPGGGFVFCPIHNVQPQTPPENIVAAYGAAYEYGRYPIASA